MTSGEWFAAGYLCGSVITCLIACWAVHSALKDLKKYK